MHMQNIQTIHPSARGPEPEARIRSWGALVAVAAAALVAGCGNIPKAQVSYYLATTTVSVQVIRSVLCDAANSPVVATTVVPTVTHQADVVKNKVQKLDLNWFRATLSDADVKVELFDDGRLKAVNASTTGQGEAVLKAAMSLVTALAAPVVSSQSVLSATATAAEAEAACKQINTQNGGDPILVFYSGVLDLNPEGSQVTIKPEAASRHYADLVAPLIGTMCAVVSKNSNKTEDMTADKSTAERVGPVQAGDEFMERELMVRQPGWADFSVRAQPAGAACPTGEVPPLFSGRALVAQNGVLYGIPVPKPALFGKQSIGLVFAESGALTSLQYTTSEGGAAQALGGLNSLLTAAKGDTPAQKAADLNARADLIAAQQRLVQCTANRANCTKP